MVMKEEKCNETSTLLLFEEVGGESGAEQFIRFIRGRE